MVISLEGRGEGGGWVGGGCCDVREAIDWINVGTVFTQGWGPLRQVVQNYAARKIKLEMTETERRGREGRGGGFFF